MEKGRLSREYAELLMNRFIARYAETAKVKTVCIEEKCPNRITIPAKFFERDVYFGCVACSLYQKKADK